MQETKRYSRREYLKILGLLGLGGAAGGLFIQPLSAASGSKYKKISRTLPLMGTFVHITIYDPSRSRAEQARELAFHRMQELIPIFNRFDPNSHISQLNAHGTLNDVPSEIYQVLQQCAKLYHSSDKYFDITILPLLELHENSQRLFGRPPNWQEIQQKSKSIGFEKLDISRQRIRMLQSDTRITLDGIAKGYIVDQAAETIRAQGVRHALINAGGDIRVIGQRIDSPWKIGIQDPFQRKQWMLKVQLKDMAIATSGSYQNHFDPEGRHHHLLDKTQGNAAHEKLSTSVIAGRAMLADGLSTALFVLPLRESMALAEKLPQVQTNILTRGGRFFSSSGWKEFQV